MATKVSKSLGRFDNMDGRIARRPRTVPSGLRRVPRVSRKGRDSGKILPGLNHELLLCDGMEYVKTPFALAAEL
jgi:hypothetical protein